MTGSGDDTLRNEEEEQGADGQESASTHDDTVEPNRLEAEQDSHDIGNIVDTDDNEASDDAEEESVAESDGTEPPVVYYNDVELGTAENERRTGGLTKGQLLFWGSMGLSVMLLTMSIVFALLMYFNVQYVKVHGSSMAPTFSDGDGVFISTRDDDPQTDDIIVFLGPDEWAAESVTIAESSDGERYFIKRVVASPGDTIELSAEGVQVNGQTYYQDNQADQTNGTESMFSCSNQESVEYVLGADEYFIMGDNYPLSTDSYAMYCTDAEREDVLVDRDSVAHFGDDVFTLSGGLAWFERSIGDDDEQ